MGRGRGRGPDRSVRRDRRRTCYRGTVSRVSGVITLITCGKALDGPSRVRDGDSPHLRKCTRRSLARHNLSSFSVKDSYGWGWIICINNSNKPAVVGTSRYGKEQNGSQKQFHNTPKFALRIVLRYVQKN